MRLQRTEQLGYLVMKCRPILLLFSSYHCAQSRNESHCTLIDLFVPASGTHIYHLSYSFKVSVLH